MTRFPKIPTVECYITYKELKRALNSLESNADPFELPDGSTFTPDIERGEVKVKVTIGFHHLIPHMQAIIDYLYKKKKYDESTQLPSTKE